MKKLIVFALFLAASCQDRRPPTPSADQSAQLDNAEDMLNDMAQNEEGPEQRPGPSNSEK